MFGSFAWASFRAVEEGGNCWWGPFVDDTNFLASVARVRDENGGPVFEQMELDLIISGDNPNWFRQPYRWWKPYRISFWTYDWPEGIYQITAMDLEGGVPVFYDYFKIRHWCDNPGEKGLPIAVASLSIIRPTSGPSGPLLFALPPSQMQDARSPARPLRIANCKLQIARTRPERRAR